MYQADLKDLQERLGRTEKELRQLADADAHCARSFVKLVEIVGQMASDLETIKLHVGVEKIVHPPDEPDAAEWWDIHGRQSR